MLASSVQTPVTFPVSFAAYRLRLITVESTTACVLFVQYMAGVHGVPRRTARCCRRQGSTFLDGHSPTVGYTMLEELYSSENPRFLCSWTLRRVVISARCGVTSIFIAIARTTPIGKPSLTAITSLSKPSLGIPQRYRRKPV